MAFLKEMRIETKMHDAFFIVDDDKKRIWQTCSPPNHSHSCVTNIVGWKVER